MEGGLRVTGLLGRVLGSYRSDAPMLLVVAILVFAPLSLLESAGELLGDLELDDLTGIEVGAVAAIVLAQTAGALLGEVFYSGAVTSIVTGARTGVRHPIRAIARELPYARLAAVDVLLVLGTALGILLLVVPGLVFFAYFALAAPIVEIEGRGVRAAFGRSRRLVRGHLRTVLGVLVPIVIGIDLLTEAADALADDVLGHTFAAEWLVATVTNVALTPFYAVAVVVLAIELIEARGERLSPAGSAPPQ